MSIGIITKNNFDIAVGNLAGDGVRGWGGMGQCGVIGCRVWLQTVSFQVLVNLGFLIHNNILKSDLKIPGFLPLWANLTNFGAKHEISVSTSLP